MRALLQRLLTELEIPAAHVTHDRDEALSIGDDLAVIVGGQLRQTGPAAKSPPNRPTPTSPACSAGQNSDPAPPPRHRPSASSLSARPPKACTAQCKRSTGPKTFNSHPDAGSPADGSLTAQVGQIVHTRPLARITLGCDPPIAALMLHRDIDRLRLTAGNTVQVKLPPGSLRVFQIRTRP